MVRSYFGTEIEQNTARTFSKFACNLLKSDQHCRTTSISICRINRCLLRRCTIQFFTYSRINCGCYGTEISKNIRTRRNPEQSCLAFVDRRCRIGHCLCRD
jgi:hypothetical protein